MSDYDDLLNEINNIKSEIEKNRGTIESDPLTMESFGMSQNQNTPNGANIEILNQILDSLNVIKDKPPAIIKQSPVRVVKTFSPPVASTPPETAPSPKPETPAMPPQENIWPALGPRLYDIQQSMTDKLDDVKYASFWGLPTNKQWAWVVDDYNNMIIKPQESKRVWFRDNEKGYLISAYIYMNNPNLTVRVKLDKASWTASPASLNALGFANMGTVGMNLILYDTINSLYCMNYVAKGWPGDPYKATSWLQLENTTNSPIVIAAAQFNRIVLKAL